MKTIDQIRAEETAAREEFESKTIAFLCEGKPVTIATARDIFERFHHTPGTDWKRPVDCRVPRQYLVLFMNAVRFYHGCEAHEVVCVLVRPSMGMMFRVTGPGYVC